MRLSKFLARAAAGFIIVATAAIALAGGAGTTQADDHSQKVTESPVPSFLVNVTEGPYFDEVTDPDFHGYPEIDHSAEQPPEETEEPEPEPCPITYTEVVMLAQTMHEESQVLCWWGDKWGVSYIARQAAVGWSALNRYDAGYFGSTLAEILSKPHQYAWSADAPVTDHFLWLAQDIVDRWWAEKQGAQDVGRTLPADYLFFEGDGKENHFRKEYEHTGETWDWSLPDPYKEAAE